MKLETYNFRLFLSLVICELETQFREKMVTIFEKGVKSSFLTFKIYHLLA